MKRFMLFAVFGICCIQYNALSQSCLPDGITFNSQSEIDNFHVNYPSCYEIEGDVMFLGEGITNLDGLAQVTSISGHLIIGGYPLDATSLKNLSGLGSLAAIGGSLMVFCNDSLKDFSGLNKLQEIGGDLIVGIKGAGSSLRDLKGMTMLGSIGGKIEITYNPLLKDLSGLGNITSVHGDLILLRNQSLKNLTGLAHLNAIEGNLNILANESFESLEGLQNLTLVGGILSIESNVHLIGLHGLENLEKINGFHVESNPNLVSLAGMELLTSLDGSLVVSNNNALLDLQGLEKITSISGGLGIGSNDTLQSLKGLENLHQIGGGLGISSNNKLNDLSDLQSLDIIGGHLSIYSNPSLTSLEGLENIHPASITDLSITGNPMLSDCEAENICEYLVSPNGKVEIYDNAPGCEGIVEVANTCDIQLSCLPYGNYIFQSQSDIDDFSEYFPGCSELKGYVGINGKDIYNLAGLKEINSIDGDLFIQGNRDLNNLKGMENLTSITGDLTIGGFHQGNHAMTSLSGFNNLTAIDGRLIIIYNNRLKDLTDLYNLKRIGAGIWMWYNPSLTSLAGLDNAELGSMTDIRITHNESLSKCEILSICSCLEYDVDTTLFDISDNAEGCNAIEEIQQACSHTISDVSYFGYSNPYGDQILFKYTLPSDSPVLLKIYDRMGREVATLVDQNQPKGTYIVEFVNSRIAAGIYLGVLETNTGKQTIKLLKVTGQ